MTLTKSNVFRI